MGTRAGFVRRTAGGDDYFCDGMKFGQFDGLVEPFHDVRRWTIGSLPACWNDDCVEHGVGVTAFHFAKNMYKQEENETGRCDIAYFPSE